MRYDLVLFSVKDINRIASVVNAVLKKDGMLYGMHITIAFLPPFDLSNVESAASDSRKNGIAAGY
jgi:hypothetical protein